MSKIKIVLDSTADVPIEWKEKYDFGFVPLKVAWPTGEVEDDSWEVEKIADFYRRIREAKELPKTSQPSPSDFAKVYREAIEDGYDEIIVLCISSKLSGTYNSAKTASMDFDIPIYVVDTKLASGVVALVALRAHELMRMGMSGKEIHDRIVEKMEAGDFLAIFYVSDFNFLVKGGRITKFQGFIGSMLKLKVAVYITETGEMVPIGKARGSKKAHELIISKVLDKYKVGSKLRIIPVSAGNEEEAEELVRKFEEYYDVEILHPPSRMAKVITTHVGPGTAGCGIERIE